MKHHYTDPHGITHTWETPDVHAPLDPIGVMATLNAIINPEYLEDYARAVGLSAQDLINEAQAWAAAMETN